jgi:hypothetical protein
MTKVYVLLSMYDGLIVDYTFDENMVDEMCKKNNYTPEKVNYGSFGLRCFNDMQEMINHFKSESTDINEE